MEFPTEFVTETFQPQFVCFATEISKKPSVALFFAVERLILSAGLGHSSRAVTALRAEKTGARVHREQPADNWTVSGALCVPRENWDGNELENGMRVRKGAGKGKIWSGETGPTDNGCRGRVWNSRNLEMGNSVRGKWSKMG